MSQTEFYFLIYHHRGGIIQIMEEMSSNAVESDDDLDWEEVQVPKHQHHLEITLQTSHSKPDKNTNKFVIILNGLEVSFSLWLERKEYRMRNVSCALIVIKFIPSHSLSMLECAIIG